MTGFPSLVIGIPLLWYLTNSFWFAVAMSVFIFLIYAFLPPLPKTEESPQEKDHAYESV